MLVGKRMSFPVITVPSDMPINEALSLMRRERIRRTPVMEGGKMVGIVSNEDLLNASPSPATSLSVWEMNYLLSKITVKDVMTRQVLTVTEDTPIEEAARLMADSKIGGLPVLRGTEVVGIITETDLFKLFTELLGARERGVRIMVELPNVKGRLAEIASAVAGRAGNFIALANFLGEDPTTRELMMKVEGLSEDELRQVITPLVDRVIDIRSC